ncbi:Alpha/beta hydrolase family protein [Spironucleus salmonicida]|uniref:Alpha/beta hydrolase n=1 Tax=Spironucleus salmonicida TaxID=348837 RepID=V6LL51_9EUKA|nr:Alpha/beta hydrolase family protein [Spironucleus salmonicida]|eukprot:EST45277.1 Alpha/beta hydrolase [Spironucleus salmonicida]
MLLKEQVYKEEWNIPQQNMLKLYFGSIATYKFYNQGEKSIFYIHGLSNSVQLSAPFLNQLSRQYNVYTFDLPGHGDSDICFDYSLEYLVYISIEVIKFYQLESFNLIGHSIGGLISARLSYYLQKNIEQVVLINPVGVSLSDVKSLGQTLMKNEKIQNACFQYPALSKQFILGQMKLLNNNHAYTLANQYLKINYYKMKQSHKLILQNFPFTNQQKILLSFTHPFSIILSKFDQILNSQKTKELLHKQAKSVMWLDAYHMCTISIPKITAGQVIYALK